MTPRRYRGSAPARFRAWVLPVVGGLLGGALAQYVGAVAFAPEDIRCKLIDYGDSVPAWVPLVELNAASGWTPVTEGGTMVVSTSWRSSVSADADATPSVWYRAPSLMERAAWASSGRTAGAVEWPRFSLPYHLGGDPVAQTGSVGVWNHRWGL